MVGALVALVSTLFTVAPAQALAQPTLLPTAGSTYNSLIGSPVYLKTNQDTSTVVTNTRNISTSYFVISNSAKARITITFGSPSANTTSASTPFNAFKWYSFSATGVASTGQTTTSGTTTVTRAASGVDGELATYTIVTSESLIAVPAWAVEDASVSTFSFNTLVLDTHASNSSTTTLDVYVLNDYNNAGAGTDATTLRYNEDLFDLKSATRTVTLYAPGEVSAVTSIDTLVPQATTTSTQFRASVVYGGSVNPWFVSNSTVVSFFKGGAAFDYSTTPAKYETTSIVATSVAAGSGTTLGITRNVLTAGVNSSGVADRAFAAALTDGIYSAQAYYFVSGQYNYVTVGAASAVADLSAGPTNRMDGVSVSHTATLDSSYTVSTAAATLTARSGTRTLSVVAQIRETAGGSTSNLAFANVEVKAVVSENSLHTSSAIAVSGAGGTLVTDGDSLTALGRTDSLGRVTFTITSTTGRKGDSINVDIYAKNETGAWVQYSSAETTEAGVNVVWADASFAASQFTAKPANYISGANPTVTFKVADQFGRGLSTIDGKVLTVYAEASFGGVAAPKTYSSTVVVANGEAKFTFANFAPAGGLAQLRASLFQGAVGGTVNELASTSVNVYNTAATDKISVVQSFDKAVTYKDFVTGDTTDPAVAKQVSDAGLSAAEGVTISGNVLNSRGVGQPGVAVTLAAKDVLFLADGVYSLGTVTTNANEFGAFSVVAISQKVNVAGHTVSITADGKTASTMFKTYLPSTLDAKNLKFSWTLPAQVVKNTTYAVTLSLTDKWGNPIAANTTSTQAAVSVQGFGSVEINSVATAVNRNFDRNGQATVFLRSVKDIAGPGSIQATLQTSGWTYPTGTTGTDATVVSGLATIITTNDTSTAWDERSWSNALSSNIEVLDRATATGGTVNVGSFNGKLVVYAANLNGARISWKVGGNWGSAVADSNFDRFDRPTPRAGVTVSVDIYVNGVKTLTKSVVTR